MYATIAIGVLAACAARAAGDAGEKHRNELKDHYDHLAYIADFPCHRPQPRVISVHKMFPDTHGKAYFPDVTVLHRCDEEAGCCTEGKSCLPVHSHPVDLPFKVTFLDDHKEHRRGSWIIEYYTLHNHTECACGKLDHYEDNQKHWHGAQDHRHQAEDHHGDHGSHEDHVGSSSQGETHHGSSPSDSGRPSYPSKEPSRPRPAYSGEQKRTEATTEAAAEEEPEVCEAENENEQSQPATGGQQSEDQDNNVKRESSSTVSSDVADLLAAINT